MSGSPAPLVRAIGAAVRMSALRRRPPVRAVERDLPMVVAAVTPEARDVVSLRLVTPDGGPPPPWRPCVSRAAADHLVLDL